jgi:hypothetical protein
VTTKQLDYEMNHLLKKLQERDREKHSELKLVKIIDSHPLFNLIEGEIEDWEIVAGTL